MEDIESFNYDVVVVGGGLAGLRAANLLLKSGKSVLVLEARDRVGGRTNSVDYDGYRWDVGGQWVGPTQDRVLALLKEFKITTFPQQQQGKKIMEFGGVSNKYEGTIPPLHIMGAIETQLTLWRIELMAKSIDVNCPWDHPKAREWDSMSLQDWINSNIYTEDAKKMIHVAITSVMSSDPEEVSLLFALSYWAGAGSVMKTLEVPNGAQQDRVLGGTQQISERLADTIGKRRLWYNKAVVAIDQQSDGDQVLITCKDGTQVKSSYVIVSVPPPVSRSIQYKPEKTKSRMELESKMHMGQVIKFIIHYKSCFWRDEGYAGEVLTDRTKTVSILFDGTFADGTRPCLIGFFEGSAAKIWEKRTEEERKQQVVDLLVKNFGDDRFKHPTHYMDKNWMAEEYSLGGYTGLCGPNIISKCGKSLRDPIGKIHFAGTETATIWPGYMEGALQSGERTSQEVLYRLENEGQLEPPAGNSNKNSYLLSMFDSNTTILTVLSAVVIPVIGYFLF
eukprot:gene6642-8218_t